MKLSKSPNIACRTYTCPFFLINAFSHDLQGLRSEFSQKKLLLKCDIGRHYQCQNFNAAFVQGLGFAKLMCGPICMHVMFNIVRRFWEKYSYVLFSFTIAKGTLLLYLVIVLLRPLCAPLLGFREGFRGKSLVSRIIAQSLHGAPRVISVRA